MKNRNWTVSALVFLCCLALMALPVAAKDRFQEEVDKEREAIQLVRQVKQGDYDVISVQELKKLIDSGVEPVVIDTMPYEASYQKAHIPTAEQFLFPIPDMETWNRDETGGKSAEDFAALLGPDKSRTIVIYCGFVKCTRSHNGAAWARKLGYRNVYRCPGGIFAWKGAGYPVESIE